MGRVEPNLDRLVGVVTTLAENVVRMSETIIRLEEGQHRLEEGQRRNDEAIGVLVRMMDEWTRTKPAPASFRPFGQVG